MKAKDSIKVGNTVIFFVDEYRKGKKEEFDGQVQSIREDGVSVIYLSGYRSRNDFIPWEDVVAKVDGRKPYKRLERASYSGKFLVFEEVA